MEAGALLAEAPAAAEDPLEPVPGEARLFAEDDYVITKVVAVLGGIEADKDKLSEAKLGDELRLRVSASVAAIQFRRVGTKRITLHADDFQV